MDADNAMLVKAAQNMISLTQASLTPNQLAVQIVADLQSYIQLADLTIHGIHPEQHIWAMSPTSLTSLKWEMPTSYFRAFGSAWPAADYIVNVVENTCLALTSLDIGFSNREGQSELPAVAPERARQYRLVPNERPTTLPHLRHFGFRCWYGASEQGTIEINFLDFIERHRQSLKSVAIPLSYGPWSRGNLEFVLKVCGMLPDLKELRLISTKERGEGEGMTPYDFFYALTTKLSSPKFSIERFSVERIKYPFSADIGKLFQPWESLKFLRMGDGDNNNGPYDNDGRLDFGSYRPHLLQFIVALPQSLEELYLEINGESLTLDCDEHFDPVCELGAQIFSKLRRLHTCDIHGWFSDIDGGLGSIPEKEVHYRRLGYEESAEGDEGPPSLDARNANKVKYVWTSRMDSIYQEEDVEVIKEWEILELKDDEGVFKGNDADEV